jgi:hypothetical protein
MGWPWVYFCEFLQFSAEILRMPTFGISLASNSLCSWAGLVRIPSAAEIILHATASVSAGRSLRSAPAGFAAWSGWARRKGRGPKTRAWAEQVLRPSPSQNSLLSVLLLLLLRCRRRATAFFLFGADFLPVDGAVEEMWSLSIESERSVGLGIPHHPPSFCPA